MKKTIGCIMFWVGIGMLLMLLLDNGFIGVIVIAVLLLLGYNLYHC